MGRHNHYRDKDFSRTYSTAGVNQTVEALRDMGDRALQAARDELAACARTVVEEAKARCPVDTGQLRDSIRAEKKRGGNAYNISADAADENGFLYGPVVEFSPKINRPFLYPAMEAHRDEVKQRIWNAVMKAANGKV